MKDNLTRLLNSAVAGQTYMDDLTRVGIWNGKPAVVTKKTELDQCILDIGTIDDAINDIGGNSVTKTNAKDNAAKTAWVVAKALAAFAEDTNNDVLLAEIDFEWSDVRYGKDVTLMDRWTLLFNRATTHVTALDTGGYGVDAALLITFNGQRATFATWKGKPQAAIADAKALNIDLENKFKDLTEIVESLKTRLVQFTTTNINFYNGCIDAFEIDMTNLRHQALLITYEDEESGLRLPEVTSRLLEHAEIKKSSLRGRVVHMQAELPQGNYTLQSSLINYEAHTAPSVVVENGKLTRLIVKLKRVPEGSRGIAN